MKTKISERASKYALGKNEMTGVAGRPRQPGRPRQGPGRPRQNGSRKAGWQTGRQEACCGSLAVLGTVQANLISLASWSINLAIYRLKDDKVTFRASSYTAAKVTPIT